MGLSDKQFWIMMILLVSVVIWGGVVMWIIDTFGKLYGLLSMTLVNVLFLFIVVFNLSHSNEVKENENE